MDRDQQMQAIILRLTGAPAATEPQSFELDEPWRDIFQRVGRVHSRAEALRLLTEAAGPDGEHLVAELRARLPGDSAFPAPSALRREARSRDAADDTAARFPSLRDIPDDTASVSWLWPSWIPCGMVTLFAAVPGMGKSLVTLDLAHRVIAGEPFPDGAPAAAPGRPVVLVDAEAVPGLLRQRAAAWQIDAGLIYPMAARSPGRPIDLSTQIDLRRLVELCGKVRPALVIVDSLASAAPRTETSVKAAHLVLNTLASLAQALRSAMLVIHHLRKPRAQGAGSHRPSAADLRGSSHLIAIARSILTLSPQAPEADLLAAPDPNGPRRLEVVKSNLCPLPPPLRLVMEPHPGAPTLHYAPLVEPPPPPTMLRRCAEWLLAYLAEAGRPVQPAEAIEAAKAAGFPHATLYRARNALGTSVAEIGTGPRDPHKRWALPPVEEAR